MGEDIDSDVGGSGGCAKLSAGADVTMVALAKKMCFFLSLFDLFLRFFSLLCFLFIFFGFVFGSFGFIFFV